MKKNPIPVEVLVAAYNALGEIVEYCSSRNVKCHGILTPDGDTVYFFTDEAGLLTPFEVRFLYLQNATVDDVMNYRDQLLSWLDEAVTAWRAQRLRELETEINNMLKSR